MLHLGSRDTTLAVGLKLLQVNLWWAGEERGEGREREERRREREGRKERERGKRRYGTRMGHSPQCSLWSTTVATVHILEIPAGDKGRSTDKIQTTL